MVGSFHDFVVVSNIILSGDGIHGRATACSIRNDTSPGTTVSRVHEQC